jgi:hypothetical protein
MKLFAYLTTAALLGSTSATVAAQPQQNPRQQGQQSLLNALNGVVMIGLSQGKSPPGQSTRPDDPDQGDDNAARRAILEVCFKNTPAAQRSAICDGSPVSP